jgi:predicted ABC-type ATPase
LRGGHNIPESVITRRYFSGIKNLFEHYLHICSYWMIFDNSVSPTDLIAEGYPEGEFEILNQSKLEKIKSLKHDEGK